MNPPARFMTTCVVIVYFVFAISDVGGFLSPVKYQQIILIIKIVGRTFRSSVSQHENPSAL